MNSLLRLAPLALFGSFLLACATADESPSTPTKDAAIDSSGAGDTGSSGGDSTATDSSSMTDTSKPDTGSCTSGATEERKCGYCGSQSRSCSGGTWGSWSSCTGEDTTLDCSIGSVRATSCDKCGIQKDTCDPSTCTWNLGSCTGMGECTEGDVETSTASCPVAGELRTRTCDSKCKWSAFSDCALPKGWLKVASTTLIDARNQHTAVWTGTEMLIWGGYGSYISPSYVRKNGAAYNLSADSWRALSASLPSALSTGRYQHTAVWSGTKMLVFGGYDSSSVYRNDGGQYDPSVDSWTAISTAPITGRYAHGAVWSTTTNEMIVWGGYGSCTGTYCSDGASYDPATDKWTALPPAPITGRYKHTMVWTGSEVVIWGGYGTSAGTSTYLRDGARYDPKTKIWTKFPDPPAELDGRWDHVSVWSGKEVLIWGGYGTYVSPTYGKSTGARYLPGGSWTSFSAPPADIFSTGTVNTRFAVQAWYGGGKLFLWSGANGNSSSGTALAGGATYDPATDVWDTFDVTDAPSNRARATVVWTGKEAILWGGSTSGSTSYYVGDGAVYRP